MHVHFSGVCRNATFYMQSCRLMARRTKLALWYFLAQRTLYATEVCFIATSNLFDWHRIQIHTCQIIWKYVFCLVANRTGFAILSSTVLKLGDIEVCFIATLKIYDCLSIQIGTYSHFSHTKINVHFSDMCRLATFYTQSCRLVARHEIRKYAFCVKHKTAELG